uniref:Uncharacterized protein n=1 Tax=Mesocestoides corti TaxID=53468 RepID=A0A5K3FJ70_MESCO
MHVTAATSHEDSKLILQYGRRPKSTTYAAICRRTKFPPSFSHLPPTRAWRHDYPCSLGFTSALTKARLHPRVDTAWLSRGGVHEVLGLRR